MPTTLKHTLAGVLAVLFAAVLFSGGCGTDLEDLSSDEIQLTSENTININTATADELRELPHVGEKMADRIVKYRESHGSFERPEELMMVDGISDARFRKMRHLISVE
jgi:competence protein ComEA